MASEHLYNRPQQFKVIQVRVRARVVRHKQPQHDEDGILYTERHPVYGAPGDEIGYCAGEHAGDEDAEHEAGDDDGEGGCAAVRGREVPDEREHELWGYGCDGDYEGYGCEDGEGVG